MEPPWCTINQGYTDPFGRNPIEAPITIRRLVLGRCAFGMGSPGKNGKGLPVRNVKWKNQHVCTSNLTNDAYFSDASCILLCLMLIMTGTCPSLDIYILDMDQGLIDLIAKAYCMFSEFGMCQNWCLLRGPEQKRWLFRCPCMSTPAHAS